MTTEKIELGGFLYFDTRVSKDGRISCARLVTDDPKMAWAEHTPTSKGIHEQVGQRNSPTVINAAYATSQFWDGRAKTLKEQAVGPVGNAIEMGHSMTAVVELFGSIPAAIGAFPEGLRHRRDRGRVCQGHPRRSNDHLERQVRRTTGSLRASEKALTDVQKKGMEMFMEACVRATRRCFTTTSSTRRVWG